MDGFSYLGMDGTTRRFTPGTANWNRIKVFKTAKKAERFARLHPEYNHYRIIKATHQGAGKSWKEEILSTIHRG